MVEKHSQLRRVVVHTVVGANFLSLNYKRAVTLSVGIAQNGKQNTFVSQIFRVDAVHQLNRVHFRKGDRLDGAHFIGIFQINMLIFRHLRQCIQRFLLPATCLWRRRCIASSCDQTRCIRTFYKSSSGCFCHRQAPSTPCRRRCTQSVCAISRPPVNTPPPQFSCHRGCRWLCGPESVR